MAGGGGAGLGGGGEFEGGGARGEGADGPGRRTGGPLFSADEPSDRRETRGRRRDHSRRIQRTPGGLRRSHVQLRDDVEFRRLGPEAGGTAGPRLTGPGPGPEAGVSAGFRRVTFRLA